MLTYVFEKSDVPLYEQVYQRVKEDIINGSLKPGEKLPSKRTFAHNHGISINLLYFDYFLSASSIV